MGGCGVVEKEGVTYACVEEFVPARGEVVFDPSQ